MIPSTRRPAASNPDKMARWSSLVSLTLGALLLHAPALPGDEVDARVEKMRGHLDACTQKFGFDPDATSGVGDHDIAPGEAAWRNCAYDGIRNIMIPQNKAASSYRYLIAFDKTLTQQIAAGKLTRSQRQKRLDQAIDDALAKDRATQTSGAAGASAGTTKSEAQIQAERNELVRQSKEAQKLRDIQSMMR